MAGYSIRPLVELSKAARGYFTQAIDGAIASVWANTFTVFGKVLALVGFELELRRKWLADQMFASTADEVWLRRHGFELDLQPDPAKKALGSITLAATPALVVPAGLQFTRADGVTYTSLASATASGNSVTLIVEADAAALAGNSDAGTALTLVDVADAPVGLDTSATVDTAGLAGGADAEGLEPFRRRVLARKRRMPQGGASPDYETWLREALGPAVQSVFVDSMQDDAREVWVGFTVLNLPAGTDPDDDDAVLAAFAADPSIVIPTLGQVAIAQSYLDDPVRRPVTARVSVIRLTPTPVPILIGALAPDTPAIRASIAAEIAATFLDRAEPGQPSDPFGLSRAWVDEAVSRATGEDRHVLVTPATDLSFTAGLLPVPGTIAYTD